MSVYETECWTYWEGYCPPFIELCLESIRRWCNARVLDRSEFEELWTHDRDIPIDKLYVAHRADFIRAYLLKHFGGAWIDADCIVLQSLEPLCRLRASYGLVCYREPPGAIANKFLIADPQAPIISDYYDSVVAYIRDEQPMFWAAIGSHLLTRAIARHPNDAKILPGECIMPISWTESERFLAPVSAVL